MTADAASPAVQGPDAKRSTGKPFEPGTTLAALGGLTIVGSFVYATEPRFVKPALVEALVWAALVMVSFAGWGLALAKVAFPARRPDVGLVAIWGASVMLVVGGLLAALGLLYRTSLLILVDAGLIAAIASLFDVRASLAPRFSAGLGAVKRQPIVAACAMIVAVLALTHFAGSAADPLTNPYDDDVAYLAFVKKLMQTGTLVEPFSFRRLSALGGQTFFMALVAPHAAMRQLNVFDRGIGTLLVVLLVAGFCVERRRPPAALVIFVLAFFLYLPNTSINTAPHYVGVAYFLGLYRTMTFASGEDRPWARAVAVGLVAAGLCTLRQNYLVAPVVLLAVSFGTRLYRAPRSERRRISIDCALVAGVAFLALLPWLVLAYRSNHTFLFPLQLGTYRKSMALQSASMTPLKELAFFYSVVLEHDPIELLPVIGLAAVFVPDSHPARPLRSMWFASLVAAAFLTHSFSLSDPATLARYLFGPLGALALIVPLAAGAEVRRGGLRNAAALVLSVAAMLAQVPTTRLLSLRDAKARLRHIDAQRRGLPLAQAVEPARFLYENVQRAIPPGAPFAAMVDEAYHLDYARNPVFNIDMPGFASLKPDMPFFEGSEKLAAYFVQHQIRYVMFVRPEHSHWLYQRAFWFARMFSDEEIWRLCAPYFVDLIDSLTSLRATRKTVHEEAGIVVLDLATPAAPVTSSL